ncbi:MAG: dehydrogenase [Alphaproteobacteria bacterium]|nr:dehydrogenase [Alphaproteobacteria bacterium]
MVSRHDVTAQALWYVAEGRIELRSEKLGPCPDDEHVLLRALFSGVSRGTERTVSAGRVPSSEFSRMRCPHQAGEFPYPVKYGYALVGEVEAGPADLVGRTVFALHPHQDRVCLPVADVRPLLEGLPPRRAVLAANMETALNILWDGNVSAGDRVLVVGGGVVGLLVAALARDAGAAVTVVDIRDERAAPSRALGVGFARPDAAPGEQDIVIHTSASEAGLALALDSARFEGAIVEASWYGDLMPRVALGGAFHSRRLRLVSSQVGAVSPGHRAEWSHARRLGRALELLCDRRFDVLLGEDIPFAEAPALLPDVLARADSHRMPVLRYT